MRSSNPAFKKLNKQATEGFGAVNAASYGGVGVKVLIYLMITVAAALFSIAFLPKLIVNNSALSIGLLIGSSIFGFISAMVAVSKPTATPIFGAIYCICEGLLLGLISALFDAAYQGIVFMALLATVLTLGIMSLLYFTGVIRVGTRFRKVVVTALLTLVATQLIFFLLSLFIPSIALVYSQSFGLQIVVSIVFIIVASLMILVDLDNITNIVEGRLDKKYEWMAAFGLMVTLIWLYMEFIRLFAIIFSNRSNN